MENQISDKASYIKGRIAVICGSLGHLHKGDYLIEPNCVEGVKDLIRLLKKDDETHISRRCMGEVNIVKNHLIHIMKGCDSDMSDLFSITLRLLINVTTPAILLYAEEIPRDVANRHIFLTLLGHDQLYKFSFDDVEFWNKICSRLTNLLEIDWAERSADDGIEIERILTLLRNVLQIPQDIEDEKKPDNDTTVHDKVLWALRQSQILELLLLITSNENEEPYYLNLLEIFSHLLRQQNAKVLARCDHEESEFEKNEDVEDLIRAREAEKNFQKNYSNTRNFKSTFVMKGLKSISNLDMVCHKSLDHLKRLDLDEGKGQKRPKRSKIPVESCPIERRSTYSVRLFLKEFCMEFLNSFNHFITSVKNRLETGRSLANDQTYYFWALNFFLQFATEANVSPDLIKSCLSVETFHFIQTNMDLAFEHMNAEKKKMTNWIKRIHMTLRAYQSMLETLHWMDRSKSPMVRAVSREIKSDVFYVVEYREMTLHLLFRYDSSKFSISYLKNLIQTTHLFIKLLEEFSKQTKLIVQKITKSKKTKKKKAKVEKDEVVVPVEKTKEEKWNVIKDDVYDILMCETSFPEIVPFDAALDIPIDDQKERAMKNIQRFLHEANIRDAVGLLRSSRQVWPENDYFGSEGMAAEDESMALQEICLADLGPLDEAREKGKGEQEVTADASEYIENEEEGEDDEEEEAEGRMRIVEQDFDIMDYKKRLVHKKVVECCGMLLKYYKKNSDEVNHCAIKVLHRIGWECAMPAMLYQASLFRTLLAVMNESDGRYNEITTFAVNLFRRFRKHATKNHVVFLELLFWKDHHVALEIQHGYEPYETKKPRKSRKGAKVVDPDIDGEVNNEGEDMVPKKRGRKKKVVEGVEGSAVGTKKKGRKQRKKKVDENDDEDDRLSNSEKTMKNGLEMSEMVQNDSDIDEMEPESKLNSSSSAPSSDESENEIGGTTLTGSFKKNRRSGLIIGSSDEDDDVNTQKNEPTQTPTPTNEEQIENEEMDSEKVDSQPSREVPDPEDPGRDSSSSEGDDDDEGKMSVRVSQTGEAEPPAGDEIRAEGTDDEKPTDENPVERTKRPRFISSDSELENYTSDDEIKMGTAKRRKPAVLDSDSDLESFDNDTSK